MKTPLLSSLLVFALLSAPVMAQQPNEKAARYLEPLLKRPGSGPLFERFVDAWLDTDTLENLEKYLAAQVKAGETTANRLLLAVYLSRQGETVKALEQFRTALAKDPASADIWYQKAVVEARTLDFDSAVASLRKALESKPAAALSLQVSQLLGRLLARSGRTDEALKVWQELMAARPEDDELREDVLELQIAEGLHAVAQATAEALVQSAKDPYKKVLRRLRLGDVHDRAGARDKALETYASCLADSGADSWLEKEITAQIEKLFRREDDLAGLKSFYAKLLEKDGRRIGLRRAQARLLVELNDTDAAVAAGRELLKLAPGDRAVREEFIALLAGANKLPEAIAQLEELKKQSPNDGELLLRLATLQNDAGKKPEAAATVRAFVKLSGDEPARLRASGLLERCGMTDEATAVLREGGDAPALRQALASVLHKSGKKEEAVAEWKKLAAGGVPAVLEAARALTAHGETVAAWELLKEHAGKAGRDAAFLTALCQSADRTDHAAEALPFVRKLAALATLPADLEAALDLAVKLVRKADQVDALTNEIKSAAASAQDFALLAALREEARDTAGAETALKQAEAASPELAAVLLVKLYTQRADYTQAAQAMERLFTSPGGRKAHYAQSLAELWLRAGHTENALKAAREWRRLAPGSTGPVLTEARLLEVAGKDAESLDVLRRAAGQFEGNDEIRAQLAESYRGSGRTADALRIYGSLYENAADLSAKMRWMQPWAQTAEEAGRTQELIEQFEERRRASRESVVPLLALAEIHRASGSYEGRRKALTEAARLKPNDPELALEIARLEAREDNPDSAIRTLRAALPNDKTGAVRQDLVLLLLRSGEREEGLRLLAEGQADALKNPAAVEGVTEGLMTRDSEESALAFLTPHLLLHPGDYRLQLLAAQLEEEAQPEAAAARLVGVLGLRNELPEPRLKALHKAARAPDDENEMLMMMRQILPAQASELFTLMAAVQKTSSFQRRNQQSVRGIVTPGELPESLEDARLTAAALLLLVAQEGLSEEKSAAILTEMERAGFAAAGLVRTIGLDSLRGMYDSETAGRFVELSAEKPEDETLLALAAISQLFDWQSSGNPETAERAWQKFGKERTSLALLGSLPAVGAEGQPAAWEEEALRAAEAVPKPEPLLLVAGVRLLGLPFMNEGRNDVRPEVRKRVLALMQRWYGSTEFRGSNMSQMGGLVFLMLANGFGESGDAAGFAKLLDDEASRTSGSQTLQFLGRQLRSNGVSQPLGFPPQGVPMGLPAAVTSILSPDASEMEMFMPAKLQDEELRKAAEQVKHPLVKLLLLVRAGDEKAAGQLIEARLTAADPDAVSYLLAAAWAERQNDFSRAAELAKKALYLPLSRETRKVLDMAFLSWADSDRGNEAVVAAAREAALRMRRDVLTPEARQRLASVMDGLGLTTEAEKLARQDAGAPGNAASGAVIGAIAGRSSGATVATSQSARLLAAGKKDEALPLLTKELQAFAREALKESGWSSVRGFDEWLSTVKQYAMSATVFKTLTTTDGDAKKLAVWGAVLDLTGDNKQAVEVFRKALAAGSTEAGVKVRLLRRIAADEPKEAARLLGELPQGSRGVVFAMLTPGRNDDYRYQQMVGSYRSSRRGYYPGFEDQVSGSINSIIRAAEVLEAYLESAPAAEIPAADWIAEALPTLAQAAVIDKSWNTPSLYSAKWETPDERASESDEDDSRAKKTRPPGEAEARSKIKARATVFDRLVAKLQATPGVACTAWEALRQRTHHDETEPMPDPVFKAGIACALLDLGARKPGAKPSPDEQPWHTVFNTMLPDATRTGRLEDLEANLLPELRRATRGRLLEGIEETWTLHRCPPDEFVAKAKEIAAKTRGGGWDGIMRAATVRKTGAELADEFLTWLGSKAGIPESGEAEAFSMAIRLVIDTGGREAAEKWLRSAWQQVAGTPEERARAVASMDEDGAFQGRRHAGLQYMSQWTTQLWREPTLTFTALRIWEQEFLAHVKEPLRTALWNRHESEFQAVATKLAAMIKEGHIEPVTKFMEESPFLGSPADFRTFGGDEGLFSIIAEKLTEADTNIKMQLGLMRSAENLTFGQSLLAAIASPDPEAAVLNGMARWQKEIAALPDVQRDDILDLLRGGSDPEGSPPEGLTKDGEAFREWLEKAGEKDEMAGVDKKVTEFLDPKNLREWRGSGSWEMENKLQELLHILVKANSPRSWDLVEKIRETAGDTPRNPEENPLAKALGRLMDNTSSEPAHQCMAIALTLHAAGAPGNGVMTVGSRLNQELHDAGRDLGHAHRDPVARMKSVADGLGGAVREEAVPLLLPVLIGSITAVGLQNMTPEQRNDAVLAWAEGPGKNHARKDVVSEIAAAARLLKANRLKVSARQFSGITDEAMLSPNQQHFLAGLRSGKINLPGRLMLAAALSETDSWQVEDILVREAVGLLEQVVKSRVTVPQWQEVMVMELLTLREDNTPLDLTARVLSSVQTGRSASGELQDIERRGIKAVFRLALRSKDDAAAARIARACGDTFDTQILAAIARDGTPEMMRSVLRHGRPGLFRERTTNGFNNQSFTPGLPAKLEASLAGVEHEDLRYMTRLAVNSMRYLDETNPPPPAGKRLAELAKDFTKIAFKEVALRERALELLAAQPESAAVVAGPIHDALEGVPVTTIATLRDEDARRRKKAMYFAALSGAASGGDFSIMESSLREVTALANTGEDNWAELADQCLKSAGAAVLPDWDKNPERLAKACRAFRAALERPEFTEKVQGWQQTAHFTALLHALADKTVELETWWMKLPENIRTRLESGLKSTGPGAITAGARVRYFNSEREELPVYGLPAFGDKEEGAKLRDAVFLRFVATPLTRHEAGSLNDFMTPGWGTIQDALRLEAQWCAAAPNGGTTARAFANYYDDRQDYARCLASADRGLKVTGPGRAGIAGSLTAWKLFALYQLNRSTEGTELFLAAAKTAAPDEEDEEKQKQAQSSWNQCAFWASAGPAKQTGSLAEAVNIAALLYAEAKDDPAFWSRLESAGVFAGEVIAKEGRTAEAQAAAAFGLKARSIAEKLGAKPDTALLTRAEAVLSGAAPGAPLIPRDTPWRWQESSTAAGEKWRVAGFDDSQWKSGSGPFGFGDEGLKTEISNKDADGSILISWPFRAEFDVADPSAVKALSINLRVDDGCILWVNGHEAGRRNLPNGKITHNTLSPRPINQADEGRLDPMTLDPKHLVKGRNAVAIELHQQRPDSSDAAFHAELLQSTGTGSTAADPAKAIQSLAPLLKDWPEELRQAFLGP